MNSGSGDWNGDKMSIEDGGAKCNTCKSLKQGTGALISFSDDLCSFLAARIRASVKTGFRCLGR